MSGTGSAGHGLHFLTGGGAMGRMIRERDWASTPLGSPEGWPPALRSALSICLGATIPTAVYWGPELRLLYNDAWAPIPAEKHPWALGRPAREVWSDIWHVVGPQFTRAMEAGESFSVYDQMLPMERGGVVHETYWNYSITPIRDDDGHIVGVFNQGSETTDRLLAERALRQSEERLALALAAANSVGIWDWDVTENVITTDARFARLYGVAADNAGARAPLKDFFARIHPDDAPRVERAVAEAVRTGEDFAEEYRLLAPDGGVRWVAAQGRCTLAADGTPLRFPGITLDITTRRCVEEALRESEARLRAITDSIDQMVWATRPDGFHDYFNQRWYDYTGMAPGTTDGEDWLALFHPDDHERTRAAWARSLATGEPYRIEYRLRHRSGAWRWVLGRAQPVHDADGRIVRWYGTCTDIQDIVDAREVLARSREELERQVEVRTQELMRAEEQMRQLQKMEAVGQLTGGIAHDFNNMLAVILGGLGLMERRLARGDTDVGRYLEGAKDGALRAAALTQRLLAFSRQQPLAPEPLDANRLVAGMTELLARTLGEHIRVETVLSAGLWRIHADAGQLENAVLNLSVNARDAMPAGGRLTIETANAWVDDVYAAENAIASGQYVQIAVTDSGTGMEPDVAARAFDPFFTTKPVGRGTGLGLSQVFGFVRQSGGHVKIYSEVGVGTTVKLYLPRFYGEAPPAAVHRAVPPPRAGRASEVVLVVEDDERVRVWSVEALRELGYTVLHASSGPEALRRLEAGQAADLLFTDVVMPDMTGRELADRALVLLPDLKVLFTTGYTRNAIVHNGMLDPGTNYLPKPFSLDQLAAKVRGVLDG